MSELEKICRLILAYREWELIERSHYEAFLNFSPEGLPGHLLSLYNHAKHKLNRYVQADRIEAC